MENPKTQKKSPLEIALAKIRKKQALEAKFKKVNEKKEQKKRELQDINNEVMKWKNKVDDSESNIDILKDLAKIKTEPSKLRAHEAATGFFNILNLFNNNEIENDFSKSYNFLHDTKKVRAAVESAAIYDKENDTVIISGTLLREKINEQKHIIDEKLKAAADQLGLDWEKVLNGEDSIPNSVKNADTSA